MVRIFIVVAASTDHNDEAASIQEGGAPIEGFSQQRDAERRAFELTKKALIEADDILDWYNTEDFTEESLVAFFGGKSLHRWTRTTDHGGLEWERVWVEEAHRWVETGNLVYSEPCSITSEGVGIPADATDDEVRRFIKTTGLCLYYVVPIDTDIPPPVARLEPPASPPQG